MPPFLPVPRNENDPPDRPVLSSLATLLCYHPGTAVKGSFLIPLVRIPRAVVLCLSSALQDQVRRPSPHTWGLQQEGDLGQAILKAGPLTRPTPSQQSV